jgi:predicted metal-dependent phosphoesterase TrpH
VSFADLHLHTYFSDGTYSPQQLAAAAKTAGLSCIGVVDHDTVDGLVLVAAEAEAVGIELIPGIELSAEYENQEAHILGYLIDGASSALKGQLAILQNNRRERIYKICRRLSGLGVALDPQSVFALAKGAIVGRLHVARAMAAQGIVTSVAEAFQKYIGDNGPAYVLGFRFSVPEAVKLIKDCAGIPVLAHPYLLKGDEAIPRFIGYGIMGIEAYYPEHTQGMTNFYLNLAKENNLLVTGGSDCHGSAKPEEKIGALKIPYALVEKLKEAQGKR